MELVKLTLRNKPHKLQNLVELVEVAKIVKLF